jgi:hypothetical protein
MKAAAFLGLACLGGALATGASTHVRTRNGAPATTFTRPAQYTMGFVLTLPWVELSVPQVGVSFFFFFFFFFFLWGVADCI